MVLSFPALDLLSFPGLTGESKNNIYDKHILCIHISE